jgi:hypothetical protein
MPCGGIYPLAQHWAAAYYGHSAADWCFHCGKTDPPCTHFVEEWDAYLHGECIDAFLQTDEGRIVLEHGHEVIR